MGNKIDISRLINEILESQQKIIHLKANIREDYEDLQITDYFSKVIDSSLFINSAVSDQVADCCQLLKEEENFEQVTLDQIKQIYEGALKIHPMDIGFYESLAFYLNNVLDQPEEGKKVLMSGIEIVQKKIDDLKKMLGEFE